MYIMSKPKKVIIVTVLIVGIGVAYWLISPLFIIKEVHESVEEIITPKASEQMKEQQNVVSPPAKEALVPVVIRSGAFMDADNFHKSSGTAQLIKIGEKYFVRFEDDFRTTNGPDLFVYFGKDGKYVAETKLGALKGNVGSQNYEVPANINPADYNEVWIWCRAFFVAFGKAILQ